MKNIEETKDKKDTKEASEERVKGSLEHILILQQRQ